MGTDLFYEWACVTAIFSCNWLEMLFPVQKFGVLLSKYNGTERKMTSLIRTVVLKLLRFVAPFRRLSTPVTPCSAIKFLSAFYS